MTASVPPLIGPDALRARLAGPDAPPLRLLDVRAGADRRARYDAGHLPGAVYVDLETDLSAVGDPARGGRHPLPPPDAFGATLGRLGVTPDTDVVIYDDASGALAAARAWWMLRSAGHRSTRVLDGGLRAAERAGMAVTTEAPAVTAAPPYPVAAWRWPTVTMSEVDTLRIQPDWLLVDVRGAERYRGEQEPIDPVAGHIEGAVNIPFAENLDDDGRFLDPETLRARYQAALGSRPASRVVVSCGSGVTACHTLLALDHAGIEGASLYVGSWSEWCLNRGASRP